MQKCVPCVFEWEWYIKTWFWPLAFLRRKPSELLIPNFPWKNVCNRIYIKFVPFFQAIWCISWHSSSVSLFRIGKSKFQQLGYFLRWKGNFVTSPNFMEKMSTTVCIYNYTPSSMQIGVLSVPLMFSFLPVHVNSVLFIPSFSKSVDWVQMHKNADEKWKEKKK